ncbi:coiled-coil domain-containing protein 150-like isoform X2 [Biomphalaria glabrata]|nr:coiled-coil domain-containing protein 150-like isoform X2 [Biomphalaria glabrata]XP_055863475.1 coiled-coil domain-containing protein 150-like isoform X2 [Biomphalaria glabrata]XP_055863476.1 coiled-coil domain-containing protein 150-like isoform X2 [Biomphalaria glabrata]
MSTKSKTFFCDTEQTGFSLSNHALKTRLANAETDTELIMQQLEEMGFSPNLNYNKELPSMKRGNTNVLKEYCQTLNNNCSYNQSNTSLKNSEYLSEMQRLQSDIDCEDSKECNEDHAHSQCSSSSEKLSKSSKHRPVTPLSLRRSPSSKRIDVQDISKSIIHSRNLGIELKTKIVKHEQTENAMIGRQELEQELLRVKKLLSQVEDELQKEIQEKVAAKEELKSLRSALDTSTIAKTKLEMKVEELNATKQKMSRRHTEFKDEIIRESNLRASLEESHATLLTRLQDMETVIEGLRLECSTHISGANSLKGEIINLRNDLESEKSRREHMERTYHSITSEKDRLLQNANNVQSENRRISCDLTRLQAQYTELIRQLEQTQFIIDSLSSENKTLEELKLDLQNNVEHLTFEVEKLVRLNKDYGENESKLKKSNATLVEDLEQNKVELETFKKAHIEGKKIIDNLEHELKVTQQSLNSKNQEFKVAADNLELELTRLRNQLETMETEKQNVLKDKETLLEEVNQTVDSLMSDRSRLQTEVQSGRIEIDSLRSMCSKLEQDKVSLMERLGSLQHQQVTQKKIEETLNAMMEQKNKLAYENGKLQSTINQLNLELGESAKKKEDVNQLKTLNQSLLTKYAKCQQEISEYKISLQRLESQTKLILDDLSQKEIELKTMLFKKEEAESDRKKLMAQLEMLEGRQLHKVSNYQKNMEEAKNVNKEIASTLEAVMASHSQLQKIAENLQMELGKRDSLISQLKSSRNKESETVKQEIKKKEEQLETLKEELRKEREKNVNKANKELIEIRKQNENLSDRNQELVKSNTDLRHRLTEIEREKEELKTKLSGQHKKMEYLHKAKKQLEDNFNRMKAVREEIEELEKMRNEYMKKNKEQGETIDKFMSQILLLQDEMRQLASAHMSAQQLLKMKEEALEKERKIREEMRKRYTESIKREDEVNKQSEMSNEKLKEAHNESIEISKHLQEAHDWFKGKFDKLQNEITASKQIHAKLETENMDQRSSIEFERSKALDAAERAKEMIQTSRQTISRLADYAELADADTKQQLADLRAELLISPSPTKLGLTTEKRVI